MREVFVSGKTLPEAYHRSLDNLLYYGEETPCPDYNTNQIECSMTFTVENPLQEPMISKCMIGGEQDLQQYVMEMLDGILDFEVEKGNWDYTYHQRMENQIDFIIDELKRNPSSRRAVINVRDNDKDMYSNDPACLQNIQFFIRDKKLHMKVLFRSNDACKATFMNAFALIMLQKKIADRLEIGVGSYTHRANSYHCYERDYGLLKGYVKRIRQGDTVEDNILTYNYEGDWKITMKESIPAIIEKVNKLKERNNAD